MRSINGKRYNKSIAHSKCHTVTPPFGLRHGMNRLPRNTKRRTPGPHFKLYEKQVPGHHIQMDVKFLNLKNSKGQCIRRFQYTAIDDTTRIRVLKIYDKHTQQNAIDFVNTVILKMPFRIKMVRTDNGYEFQTKFHWHLMDLGISHAYIRVLYRNLKKREGVLEIKGISKNLFEMFKLLKIDQLIKISEK